jgi:nitrate/TMAO reductase-like tetraheme cytochrome c subunit
MSRSSWVTLVGGALVAVASGVGCTSDGEARSSDDGTAPVATRSTAGGAELWANNCRRCHNVRSPSIYSDAEWDVAMHHMRVRGNLTGEEERAIVEFLKAGN